MKLSEGLYSSISHSTRKEYLGDCFWLFTWKLVSMKGAEKKNEQEKISGSEEQEKVQKNRYGWTIRCLQALRMGFMFPAKSLVCGCLFMKQAFKSLLKLMEVKRLCLLILLFLLLLNLHLMSFNKHIAEMDWRPTKTITTISWAYSHITNLCNCWLCPLPVTIRGPHCEAKVFSIHSTLHSLKSFAFHQPVCLLACNRAHTLAFCNCP